MVAQACETVMSVPQWTGRRSPFAAATAVEHQPMDLVKRKPGKLGSLQGGYDDRQHVVLRQTQSQEDVFLKSQQKRDEFQYQNEPRQSSQDEAQQPEPAKQGSFQKGQHQQDKSQCNYDEFQPRHWKQLQHQQHPQRELKLQQSGQEKVKLQQCQQDEMQRDKVQSQQHERSKLQQRQGGKLQHQQHREGGKLQHQQHQNDERQLCQRYECDHTQQQPEQCLRQQDKLQEQELEEVETIKGQPRHQQEKLKVQQCQQDKLQLQHCQEDNLQPYQQNELQLFEPQQDKLQPKHLVQQAQPLERVFYQHLIQDDVAHKEKEIASEGASTLLLLADGNHKFSKKGTKNTKTFSEVQLASSGELESIDKYPQLFENCLSKGEQEQYAVDDDRDGTLIIVDSEDSTIYRQADCIEQVANEDGNDGNEDGDRDETDTDIVNHFSSANDTTSDEGDKKESNESRRRSGSRSASQRKMDAGKQWLVMSLMEIGGLVSIIKLGEIEKSYLAYCQKNDMEPLATPVLARLIHSLFPTAEKCRLGTRGNQRIHYRNLAFKSDANITLQSAEPQSDVSNQDQEKISKDKQQRKDNGQNLQSTLQEGECLEQHQLIQDKPPVEISGETNWNVIDGEDNKLKESQNQDESPLSPQSISSQDDDEESCKIAANKLSEVLKWITSQGESHKKALLRDFAHSASCQKATCVPVCMMFRRVRRHVVAAQHSCSVLRLYSKLLRYHVASCTNSKCGLPACPALRATRPTKRLLEQQQHAAKRAAVAQGPGLYRPASIVLGPRSPLGSLPGSPVNSPPSSPEASPLQRGSDWSVPSGQGQVQYIMVPVMMPVIENGNI